MVAYHRKSSKVTSLEKKAEKTTYEQLFINQHSLKQNTMMNSYFISHKFSKCYKLFPIPKDNKLIVIKLQTTIQHID